ncbi:MAG: XdhC family protein [Armatimonadetes bacterium]|jgi:xanthine dehydrogenase accessory factor|nr:XdhC family protein [Armatimonadota bacterium]
MRAIAEEIARVCEAGESACLATLIHSVGSVPMSQRAKLLVRADGSLAGTIGGGCLEAEVWQLAREVIGEGRGRCLSVRLDQAAAAAEGLVCGGRVEILLEPVGGAETAAFYREVAALLAGGGRAVLATPVDPADAPGGHLLVRADGSLVGGLDDASMQAAVVAAAPEVLAAGVPRLAVCAPGATGLQAAGAPGRRVFLEPLAPEPTLLIFGAGHVGLATARMGALVGMRVVVVDDRAEFAHRARFPGAEAVVVESFTDAFARFTPDESTFIVIVTRGHQHDETVLAQALRTPARYVGMIGSRRKVAVIFRRLREQGFSEAELARVRAPIGLAIGADTPEEIAVSILAEVIAVRRGAWREALSVR